ncbi:hypothetical protein J4772_00595 [Cohnella sp. LGH]|uniref:hypothetical protein n=1 Tax=Cohnella sp. LGH TaxID=1619153 RepID=UPI001ADC0B6F|nr:hypothetical protein [Cohnella sp. LGH]QTH43027.1 hypothetical protein J4772_00595 [Cohnella sp. LGH]
MIRNRLLKLSGASLQTSLSLSFMIMSVVVLIVSAVGIYFGVQDIWQKRSEKSTLQLFEQLQYSVDVMRHDADKVSKLFLIDPDIQEYLETISDKAIPSPKKSREGQALRSTRWRPTKTN